MFLLSLLCMYSCYDENNNYGEKLVDTSFRNIHIDTSTVIVTTVFIDSLETSEKNVALIGAYKYPLWGTASASTYLTFSRPSYNTDIDETVILDSLVLLLTPTGYFIGDTTKTQTFSVFRLTEKIILNDNGYLYNKDKVNYDPTPLGTFSYIPRPNSGEMLEFRLSDSWGNELLSLFHSRDNSVSSDHYSEYMKGIVIIPDIPTSHSVLAFNINEDDSTVSLALRYHVISEKENEAELIFQSSIETQFNHIEHDRSGTLLENYTETSAEIPSSQLDNTSIVMGGTGWYTRLDFPHLNNLREQGEFVEIQSAYLKIYPKLGTYSDFNPLPEELYLYIVDENNVVTDAVMDYFGDEVQSSTLKKDDIFHENTYYYFDITDFMKEELGALGIYKHSLQLVLNTDDYTKTLKNLTLNNQQTDYPITLELTYKIYESY